MNIISKASTDLKMLDCGSNQFSRHPAAPIFNPTTDTSRVYDSTGAKLFENKDERKAS